MKLKEERRMEKIGQILMDLDWNPLFISLKTGAAATVLAFFLGIYAAKKCACKAGAKGVFGQAFNAADGFCRRRQACFLPFV